MLYIIGSRTVFSVCCVGYLYMCSVCTETATTTTATYDEPEPNIQAWSGISDGNEILKTTTITTTENIVNCNQGTTTTTFTYVHVYSNTWNTLFARLLLIVAFFLSLSLLVLNVAKLTTDAHRWCNVRHTYNYNEKSCFTLMTNKHNVKTERFSVSGEYKKWSFNHNYIYAGWESEACIAFNFCPYFSVDKHTRTYICTF